MKVVESGADMTGIFLGEIVFGAVVILLIILLFISLTLCIRRMLITQSKSAENNKKVEEKLDKIIELLERENRDG